MSLPDPTRDPEFYRALLLKRALAWAVDFVITLALVLGVLVVTLFVGLFFFPVLWVAVSVAYRWVMLSRYGATAGMMLMAIKLRRLDGRRPDSTLCLIHALIFSAAMVTVIGQVLSVALMLITPYRQGLNDLILGTTVINRFTES